MINQHGQRKRAALATCCLAACLAAGCIPLLDDLWYGDNSAPVVKLTSSTVRAGRRLFDGGPPVIPHAPLGGDCTNCHGTAGRALPGQGMAPANPHLETPGIGASANCRQCHVFRNASGSFVANSFKGLAQNFRPGFRSYPGAPPVMPHSQFMREDCTACHAGPAARPEILCTHPERTNCIQCHVSETPTQTTKFLNPAFVPVR